MNYILWILLFLKIINIIQLHSSVLNTKLGSIEYFFMNLSNHLSIVLRGTTSMPSAVAFSFFNKFLDTNYLPYWKKRGSWRDCRQLFWQTLYWDRSATLSLQGFQCFKGALIARPASTRGANSLKGSTTSLCERCLKDAHLQWHQQTQG